MIARQGALMRNIREDLKPKNSDYAYAAGKSVLSVIPFIGGPILELYTLIFSEPISKRRDEWLILLGEELEKLEEKFDSFNIDSLKDNEQFITMVLKASQIVIRDHTLEKKKALANACVNTAMKIKIDDAEQMMFLNFVDELTVWHLRVLDYFSNPVKRLQEKNISTNSYMAGSPSILLFEYYPELHDREDFTRIIVKDLYTKGLLNTDSISGVQTVQGMVASRLTDFGKRFISFISETDR